MCKFVEENVEIKKEENLEMVESFLSNSKFNFLELAILGSFLSSSKEADILILHGLFVELSLDLKTSLFEEND